MTAKSGKNVYDDALTSLLGTGVNSIFETKEGEFQDVNASIETIDVLPQIRQVFEDAENTIQGLADDIAEKGLINPVTLRIVGDRYTLAAGERRLRACKLLGWTSIPSRAKVMTDEEFRRYQIAENIHRLNLKLAEEAQAVYDRYKICNNSVKITAEYFKKSESYVSKRLSLFELPEQAKRVIVENASADLEVINSVKTIEKIDSNAAKELVDKLAQHKGNVDARALVSEVKAKVKPKKESSQVDKLNSLLSGISVSLENLNKDVSDVITTLDQDARQEVEVWCKSYFITGSSSTMPDRYIIDSLRNKQFSANGIGCLALASFLHGMKGLDFDLKDVFESVKKNKTSANHDEP